MTCTATAVLICSICALFSNLLRLQGSAQLPCKHILCSLSSNSEEGFSISEQMICALQLDFDRVLPEF